MKKIKNYPIFVLLTLFIFSCSKELDFDKTDEIDINFGLNIPVVTANLNLKNFIDSNENIIVDSDGALRVEVKEDNIFDLSIKDFTSVPDQELFNQSIVIGNVDFPISAPLDNVGDFDLDEFTFEDGKFEFTAITTTTDPINIKINIKNGSQSGNPVIFEFPTTGLTTIKNFDLSDLKMDFSSGSTNNQISIEYSSSAAPAHVGSSLQLSCKAINVEIQSIKGDFGNLEVDIPSGDIDLNIDGFEKFVDGLIFTNPKFNLIVENELGFSLGLDLNLSGENEKGNKKDLTPPNLIISQPTNYGDKTNETLSINNSNSNIVDLLSISPNKLKYGGKANMNPGTGPYSNYLHKDFECKGSLDVQIPLELKVNDLVYETIMEDTELISDTTHDIQGAELSFKVTNTFPLGADINMILLDDDFNDVDTIVLPLLKAANVDADGISSDAVPNLFSVKFTENNIQNLYNTKHLKFIGHLTSTDGGSKNVKIIDSYNIEIKMALKINGSITSENN